MKTQIFDKMKYDLNFKGHERPLLCKDPSGTFIYEPILMKIRINANNNIIMKI